MDQIPVLRVVEVLGLLLVAVGLGYKFITRRRQQGEPTEDGEDPRNLRED
ncbi:MAG: hypothetical protein H8E35_03485 [Ardenticatenia bacterium]|nr:hypothetical protein [Ardenticatenia bacterium]